MKISLYISLYLTLSLFFIFLYKIYPKTALCYLTNMFQMHNPPDRIGEDSFPYPITAILRSSRGFAGLRSGRRLATLTRSTDNRCRSDAQIPARASTANSWPAYRSYRGRKSSPIRRDTTASSQQSCSLSVALQMASRASTAAACRAYRAKKAGAQGR